MISVRQLWRAGRISVLALIGWLTVYGAALAQAKATPVKGESINSEVYVLAYFLVIFGIALGTLIVCRSSNRRERARPEQYAESKILKAEEE